MPSIDQEEEWGWDMRNDRSLQRNIVYGEGSEVVD